MLCKLINNIKHSCDYNAGGIQEVYLLDISEFSAYHFADDGLFDTCMVERIESMGAFLQLDVVNETAFTETSENGVYRQSLSTFVHTLAGEKLSSLLPSARRKYLVAFRNPQGRMYCFGSDGGASLSFTQVTGQTGETAGYQITLTKNSVYPLLELDASRFNKVMVLGREDRLVMETADGLYAVMV